VATGNINWWIIAKERRGFWSEMRVGCGRRRRERGRKRR
jgi:hypothetical protein